ncbi:hypothetical protein EJB05_49767, partial [Eragrostis curvula]
MHRPKEIVPAIGNPKRRECVNGACSVPAIGHHLDQLSLESKTRADTPLLQYAKNRHQHAIHPSIKVQEGSQVTEETILTVLRRALNQYSSVQAPDGHWPGDYSGILFILPLMNKDGGWSTHTLGPSSMFGTCVNYATLRVLDESNDALSKGRSWILSHGSATAAPQWAKIYLSIIGVYDWSGNNPIIPELWMLPHFLPIHPGRFWCFCRMVYMPMAYIFAKKFVGPITPTVLAIRDEIYNTPYSQINWSIARSSCAKEDIIYPPSWLQRFAMSSLNKLIEPLFNQWPMNKLREKALNNLMEHIHYEDENSNYIGLCPINKVLNMICCWIEKPNSDKFRQHLPRIYDFLWLAEDGMKSKVYVGCHTWETALIVQAYCSTGLTEEFGAAMEKAHITKGSWTLSNGENNWPIADTTAEALKNKDGTLSSAESKRTTSWVEKCPRYRSSEIEKIIKNGASFIEKGQRKDGSWYGSWAVCFTYATFFAIKGLVAAGRTYQNSVSIRKACDFLLSKQLNTGGWGEDYLSCQIEEYVDRGSPHVVHTAMPMLGLLYAGQIERDPAPLYRAAKELINMQLETGEFPQQGNCWELQLIPLLQLPELL